MSSINIPLNNNKFIIILISCIVFTLIGWNFIIHPNTELSTLMSSVAWILPKLGLTFSLDELFAVQMLLFKVGVLFFGLGIPLSLYMFFDKNKE